MFWLFRNILIAISSEKSPFQLASGVSFGIILGFCPYGNPLWWSIFCLTLLLRVNLSMAIAFFSISKIISFPLFFLTTLIGKKALQMESLNAFLEGLYNTPYIALSGFNHPDILGALIFSVALSLITFPIFLKLIKSFRSKILPKLEKFWIVKVLKGSRIYQWYIKVIG